MNQNSNTASSRRKILVTSSLLIGVLLFSFQNCQQPPYQDELNGNEPVVSNPGRAITSPGKASDSKDGESSSVLFELDPILDFNFSFYSEMSVPMERNGNTFSLIDRVEFAFNLKSGHVIAQGADSGLVEKYCLNDEQLGSLVQLLSGKKVCQIEREIPEGTMCTMALVPGYARIQSEKINQVLGASNNGCRSSTVDLCENQGQLLKVWFEDFKTHRKDLVCDF